MTGNGADGIGWNPHESMTYWVWVKMKDLGDHRLKSVSLVSTIQEKLGTQIWTYCDDREGLMCIYIYINDDILLCYDELTAILDWAEWHCDRLERHSCVAIMIAASQLFPKCAEWFKKKMVNNDWQVGFHRCPNWIRKSPPGVSERRRQTFAWGADGLRSVTVGYGPECLCWTVWDTTWGLSCGNLT